MRSSPRLIGILALASLCAWPAADTELRIGNLAARIGAPGTGECDIRLRVQGDAEVTVRRDTLSIHTGSAGEASDDGSRCSAPMPEREMPQFHFEAGKGRAEIRLTARPSPGNDYAAVVAIHAPAAGGGRCDFRLRWEVRAADLRDEESRAAASGFSPNNALRFTGTGHGVAAAGGMEWRLSTVTVAFDRAGRAEIAFRAGRDRQLQFTGNVTAKEDAGWRAEVMSEDGKLRGAMVVAVDEKDRVRSVTLEGQEGTRLQLKGK
jgi:hypothetical protein